MTRYKRSISYAYELHNDKSPGMPLSNATIGGMVNSQSIMLMCYKMTKGRHATVTRPNLADQCQLWKFKEYTIDLLQLNMIT